MVANSSKRSPAVQTETSIYEVLTQKFDHIYQRTLGILTRRNERSNIRVQKKSRLPKKQNPKPSVEMDKENHKIKELERKIDWLINEKVTKFDGLGDERLTPLKIKIPPPPPLPTPSVHPTDMAVPAPPAFQTSRKSPALKAKAPNTPIAIPVMKTMLEEMKSVKLKPIPKKIREESNDDIITKALKLKFKNLHQN